MTYKLVKIENAYSISKDNLYIPRDLNNIEYIQFLDDIAEENDTVEGADIVPESYTDLRVQSYPSMQDQLDMQYWDSVNGTTTWKEAIDAIKEAHPKADTPEVTVESVPDWVQNDVDAYMFDKQLQSYTNAVARLEKIELSVGREETTTTIVDESIPLFDEDGELQFTEEGVVIMNRIESVITQKAIAPVEATIVVDGETVANPLVAKDEAERTTAQSVIDSTPQAVIDAYEA
jgi:hypothetical protein